VKRLQSADISCTALAYIYNPIRYPVPSEHISALAARTCLWCNAI